MRSFSIRESCLKWIICVLVRNYLFVLEVDFSGDIGDFPANALAGGPVSLSFLACLYG